MQESHLLSPRDKFPTRPLLTWDTSHLAVPGRASVLRRGPAWAWEWTDEGLPTRAHAEQNIGRKEALSWPRQTSVRRRSWNKAGQDGKEQEGWCKQEVLRCLRGQDQGQDH